MYTESYMQKRGNKLILQPENIMDKSIKASPSTLQRKIKINHKNT